MRKQTIVIPGLALLLAAATATAEPPEWIGRGNPEIHQLHIEGGGSWKAHGRKRRTGQRWSLNIDRDDDGGINGSVDVDDSELFSSGRVEGKIKGRRVAGTIFDEQGEAVATFTGVFTPDGVNGSYTDRTGATGEWIWEGSVPE